MAGSANDAVLASLPGEGLLLFFYDAKEQPWGFRPADGDGWKVLHVAGPTPPLRSAVPPPDLPIRPFQPQALQLSLEDTLPGWESPVLTRLGMTTGERDRYFALTDQLRQRSPAGPSHRIDGYPEPIQGDDMELECQLASNGLDVGTPAGYNHPRAPALRRGRGDWRLLLQLDSDDTAGMMWGDVGRLYFWIRLPDLRARRFDRVWLVLQCS